MNLRTTMVDFISGDSSRKKVVLRREAPAKVSGVTGYRGCPRTGVSPTSGATPAKIATGGSNAPTCVHGASSGFPAKVSVSP